MIGVEHYGIRPCKEFATKIGRDRTNTVIGLDCDFLQNDLHFKGDAQDHSLERYIPKLREQLSRTNIFVPQNIS